MPRLPGGPLLRQREGPVLGQRGAVRRGDVPAEQGPLVVQTLPVRSVPSSKLPDFVPKLVADLGQQIAMWILRDPL